MKYEIVEKLPDAGAYNRLRQAVGWGTYEPAVIDRSLPASVYGVCALANSEIIGMARIIGDGGLVFYIQDVIVMPAYQRMGIGTEMMNRIMTFVSARASHNSYIGLMSASGKERFYERYGFTRRPTESLGSGMTISWKVAETA
ncbi:MAG: GNAT family N-acetyltransferase [Chloroflexota bacterium]